MEDLQRGQVDRLVNHRSMQWGWKACRQSGITLIISLSSKTPKHMQQSSPPTLNLVFSELLSDNLCMKTGRFLITSTSTPEHSGDAAGAGASTTVTLPLPISCRRMFCRPTVVIESETSSMSSGKEEWMRMKRKKRKIRRRRDNAKKSSVTRNLFVLWSFMYQWKGSNSSMAALIGNGFEEIKVTYIGWLILWLISGGPGFLDLRHYAIIYILPSPFAYIHACMHICVQCVHVVSVGFKLESNL